MNNTGDNSMQETVAGTAPPTKEAQDQPFTVQVALNPSDVEVCVRWRLTGTKQDWDDTLGGAYLSELYSRTRALARVQADYGPIVSRPEVPTDYPLPPAPELNVLTTAHPAPAPEQEAPMLVIQNRPPAPAPTLNERIERAEKAGQVLPTQAKPKDKGKRGNQASPLVVREFQEAVIHALREHGGEMRLAEIKAHLPERHVKLGTPEAFRQRVVTLVEHGRLATRRDESVHPAATYYRYVPREGEDAGESHTGAPLARATALLKGKRVLLIGGKPNQERKAQLEGPLGLILRWPDLGPDQEWDVIRAEVLRNGYDVLFINNKFRRHYHGKLPALAREHGIPFITLPKGNSTAQVADAVLSNEELFRAAEAQAA
jgi:hypothetical protein